MSCRGLSRYDPRPLDASLDDADGAVVNSVVVRQLLVDTKSSDTGGPLYVSNLFFLEDRHSMSLAHLQRRRRESAVTHCVSDVFFLAAAVEVVGVAAAPVAAAMVHLAFGFMAVEQGENSTVSTADSLPAKGGVSPVAVAGAHQATTPLPALTGVADLHFPDKVFPGPCGLYCAPHQPVSSGWSRLRDWHPLGHPNDTAAAGLHSPLHPFAV